MRDQILQPGRQQSLGTVGATAVVRGQEPDTGWAPNAFQEELRAGGPAPEAQQRPGVSEFAPPPPPPSPCCSLSSGRWSFLPISSAWGIPTGPHGSEAIGQACPFSWVLGEVF